MDKIKLTAKLTWDEAVAEVMEEFKEAWEAMAGTEDIERWKRTDQYRREIRQGLWKPNIVDE